MGSPALSWLSYIRRTPLLLFLIVYTVISGGPFLWVAAMSLRTTPEIFAAPYAFPSRLHWEKFVEAWTKSNYGTYFWNSDRIISCGGRIRPERIAKRTSRLPRKR